MGLTGHLVFAIIASAVGCGFQHGYSTGVMNNPQMVMMDWLKGSIQNRAAEEQKVNLIWSTITAIYCLGGMVGALLVGVWCYYFGLKWGIIWNNIFIALSALFVFLSKELSSGYYELLIIARFILGVNSGLNAGLCPMYLNEISSIDKRGAIASIYQLMITISILIAQCLGFDAVLGTPSLWAVLFGGVILVPAVLQCVMMPFCPESPRILLIVKKDAEKCKNTLKWLRNQDDNSAEIADMEKEAAAQEAAGTVTWGDLFMKKSLRTPLIISLMIMLAQQLSGINAIIVYSNEIYRNAGLDDFWAALGTIFIGFVNVLMTIVSVVLVEVLGRKTLLLIGFGGTTIFMTLLAICIKFSESVEAMGWLCIILVLGYIISFATGPGSIPWVLMTELFKQDARAKATSLAVFTNWFANTFVMLSFLPLKYYLGYFVFLIFIIFQILFLIFIIFMVPETKNRPIEEITALFQD